MYALVELSGDTGYTVDELLNKSLDWIIAVSEINADLKFRSKIQLSKFFGMANRVNKEDLLSFEKLFEVIPEVDDDGETIFQDDIRLFEQLGGTIEKKPAKKGKK